MDTIVLTVLMTLTLFMSLKKSIYGLACFLMIRILIPEAVRVLNGSISLNTAIILIVFSVTFLKQCIKRKIKKYDPLIFMLAIFVLYSFISLFLSNYANLGEQLSYLIQFIITDFLPAIIAIYVIDSKNDIVLLSKVLVFSVIICGVYGCISYAINSNIYLDYWNIFSQNNTVASWRGKETSSTFTSVNALGYFISMSLPICFFINEKEIVDKKRSKFAIAMLLILTIICKKRTAIISVGFFLIVWFASSITKKKIITLSKVIVVGVLAVVVVFKTPSLQPLANYIKVSFFFWNDNLANSISKGNTGSTWNMRIMQIIYPFIEIKGNLLFGHGKGWCAYYLTQHPFHPIMFGFETITSKIICEYGVFGIPLFIFFFYSSYRYSRPGKKYVNKNFQLIYLMTIIVMAVASGLDYYYLYLFYVVFLRKFYLYIGNCELMTRKASI